LRSRRDIACRAITRVMEAVAALATGIVLAASAGLRAFLPVFAASLGVRFMGMPVPEYLDWIASPVTMIIFGAATVVEILGDKIPAVDHALDAVQSFTKPLLAAVAATPFLFQFAPEHAAALGLAVGIPLALGVHATKATVRAGSTVTTAGLGNPVLSVAEDIAAVVAIVLAFVMPLLALILTVILLAALVRLARRAWRRRLGPIVPES
jgi:hypothetical protein